MTGSLTRHKFEASAFCTHSMNLAITELERMSNSTPLRTFSLSSLILEGWCSRMNSECSRLVA